MLVNYIQDVSCNHPLLVVDKTTGVSRYVRCGKCALCVKKKKVDWSVRLLLESRCYNDNAFATLTYQNNPNYIFYDYIQKLIKRMRKSGLEFKYFCANEYGIKTGRPHHHIIFFGLSAQQVKKSLNINWPYGFISVGSLSDARVFYTANYCNKKMIGLVDDHNFSHGSQGLGLTWLLQHLEQVKRDNYINVNGFRYVLPTYFVRKLKDLDEKWYCDYIRSFSDELLDEDYKRSVIIQKNNDIVAKYKLLKGGVL